MSQALTEQKFNGLKYDLVFHESNAHNFLTDDGFAVAIHYALRLKPYGFMVAGPQCTTWVWIARNQSKRSREDPMGDTSRQDVRDANELASRLAILVLLLTKRGCHWVIEQPGSSFLFLHPDMESALNCVTVFRWFLWLGNYGHTMPKPTILINNLPMAQTDIFDVRGKPRLAKHGATEKKGKWVCGTKKLGESASYPVGFCEKFARGMAMPPPFARISWTGVGRVSCEVPAWLGNDAIGGSNATRHIRQKRAFELKEEDPQKSLHRFFKPLNTTRQNSVFDKDTGSASQNLDKKTSSASQNSGKSPASQNSDKENVPSSALPKKRARNAEKVQQEAPLCEPLWF